MHCGPPYHNFGWAISHVANPAAPPIKPKVTEPILSKIVKHGLFKILLATTCSIFFLALSRKKSCSRSPCFSLATARSHFRFGVYLQYGNDNVSTKLLEFFP